MERTEQVETPAPPDGLFAVVEDLGRYSEWLDIVVRATPAEPLAGDDGPAWSIELRGRLGPLARSKRLRMVRTVHAVPERVVFERREAGERSRSPWTLTAEVTPTAEGSRLTMSLHYGGALVGAHARAPPGRRGGTGSPPSRCPVGGMTIRQRSAGR